MEEQIEKWGITGSHKFTDYLRFAFWILLIIAVGFAAINQGLGFFYKAHLLKAPCDLCVELNPGVQECIDRLNAPRPSFPDGNGGWSDPFTYSNSNYQINIAEIYP